MLFPNPTRLLLQKEEIQHCIENYSVEELEVLLEVVKATLKARKRERKQEVVPEVIPIKKGREVVETCSTDGATYRLEMVKCGKKKCKCNKGKLHGPYWYAYHWDGKKLSSTYIGKTLNMETPNMETPTENCADEAEQNRTE